MKALLDKNDFEDRINEFDRQREELPSYNDFGDCLLSSGIISYGNLEDVEKSEYKKFRRQGIPAIRESTEDKEENDRTIARSLRK
ncbi:hypothetical protein AKJ40_01325 [candidate division MSBL1 archaeon SCGC-AAA259M10]|uniref:Uncharacterized protein n=1 Tax=candidate division MSBL1 archaeon SCGC-AAA259M10 TaxID=1698270 RepID=A0A133V1Z9_9EURY|nr:hypothetical protein AKJ40_01325 [candidate division MSBL1 archaeon SCGC-AAA259M10]